MIGVDANLIVRLLTGDDEKQFRKAEHLFTTEQIYIADTVLLETEWVLRFAYKFKPDAIHQALTRLLGLPNVHINNPENMYKTLQLYEQGLDFADAIHLVANIRQDTFFTFDKAFIKRAQGLTDCPVREP